MFLITCASLGNYLLTTSRPKSGILMDPTSHFLRFMHDNQIFRMSPRVERVIALIFPCNGILHPHTGAFS